MVKIMLKNKTKYFTFSVKDIIAASNIALFLSESPLSLIDVGISGKKQLINHIKLFKKFGKLYLCWRKNSIETVSFGFTIVSDIPVNRKAKPEFKLTLQWDLLIWLMFRVMNLDKIWKENSMTCSAKQTNLSFAR